MTPVARPLFGARAEILAFDWHHESFAIPAGARRTLFGVHCLNKGFVHGKHLAFPNVQSEADMHAGLGARAAMTHGAARAAYRAWTAPIFGPVPSRRHAPGYRPSAQ